MRRISASVHLTMTSTFNVEMPAALVVFHSGGPPNGGGGRKDVTHLGLPEHPIMAFVPMRSAWVRRESHAVVPSTVGVHPTVHDGTVATL